ncbi:MAG: dihydropteroate synthase, partial [Usitatibacter sp.]
MGRPRVLGIVNVTADSFSDGGRFLDPSRAIAHALKLRDDGADFVDVGGESTRPGAAAVAAGEELARVMPVVEALVKEGVAVSVDTMKPEVMRAALAAGCAVVNDVNAFRAPGAIEAVANSRAGLVVMHMQGTPSTMQRAPSYGDVVAEVGSFLVERARELE